LKRFRKTLDSLAPGKILRSLTVPVFCGGLLFQGAPALACASCGSGGGDPLILYPNEDLKFFGSFGLQKVTREVSTAGKRGEVFGPDTKYPLVLSLGARFNRRGFVTLTSGYQINTKEDKQGQGAIDPSFMVRYTVLSQSFDEPWIPQVQGLVGYKRSTGRSIHTSQDKDLIDITSSGFDEGKIGIDLWYGMFDFKGGLAFLGILPQPRTESDGSKNEAGNIQRWTVTGAYQLSDALKLSAGLNRQSSGTRRYEDQTVDDSETLDHSGFLNMDFMGYDTQSVRLGATKTALFSDDRLTTETYSFTLAFLFTL
jgi:hypothetical protein